MRKLLLLYLFITFCFGLVFNSNANAAVLEVCDVGPGNHLVKVHTSERKYYKNSILINAPYMSCATHFKKKGKILYKAVKRRLKKTQYKIEWSGELLEKRSRGYTHTILDTKYAKILRSFNSNIKFSNDEKQIAAKQKKIEEPKLTGGYSLDTTWDGIYKWNGIVVSKDTYCFNADLNNMSKYYPDKYNLMCLSKNNQIVKKEIDTKQKHLIKPNTSVYFVRLSENNFLSVSKYHSSMFLNNNKNMQKYKFDTSDNLFKYKMNRGGVLKTQIRISQKLYDELFSYNESIILTGGLGGNESNEKKNLLKSIFYKIDTYKPKILGDLVNEFTDNNELKNNLIAYFDQNNQKIKNINEAKIKTVSSKNFTYKWNGKKVSKTVYCSNALLANLKKYEPQKYEARCGASSNKIIMKEKTLIAKNKEIGIPKNLIGSYEGKNSQGDPFKLNINTNKYGEIIGNYTYEANNKVYGGPLYDGKLLDDQTLKIFWTEGDTNGWFKFKFRENFAKLDGDWGFIENNWELPKKGKYKGVKANTAIAKKSEQEEFKPKNFDKDPPVIKIAENITVKDSSYEIEGTLIDKSKKLFVEVDGEFLSAKNGKFKIKRFSLVDEKIEIVAIDQWGNRSNPKIINIKIDDQDTQMVQRLEPLDPSKIRSKINKNRVALIIGIENYEQTPDATYANLDAKYFYEYARKGFGVQKSNIKLLVDEDANLISSLGTINKWLPGKVKENRTELFVFFAGHGLASNDGKELYILPQDSDPDLLSRTALSRNELFSTILNLNPKSVTMFFDTCFSGISRDEKILLASARPIRIIADEQEGTPDNFTIFSASQLNQISSGLEEANHGIFSYFLMKGLEGNADTNKDKKITNGELLAYMEQNVSMKASELGRQQNPSLTGDPDKILMRY
ncbi:caspase family protein [Pelagibacterales bacterium SAG-MED16]|nr:caspase family protein [Pelagibacterales bacterium SAG-MED16]